MIAVMKWLRENAGVLSLAIIVLGLLWTVFVEYGKLAKKSEIEALRTVLKTGLLELAECVDHPKNAQSSGPEQLVRNCEIEVYRALDNR